MNTKRINGQIELRVRFLQPDRVTEISENLDGSQTLSFNHRGPDGNYMHRRGVVVPEGKFNLGDQVSYKDVRKGRLL